MVKFYVPAPLRSRTRRMTSAMRQRGRNTALPSFTRKSRVGLAVKPKQARKTASVTMLSRPKRKTDIQRIQPKGPGVTTDSVLKKYQVPNGKVRAMKKVGEVNFYLSNAGFTADCGEGFQNAQVFTWNGINDLQIIRSKVGTSGTVPVPGTVIPNSYVLEAMLGELVFSNASIATAEFEIYDIIRKRDATGASQTDTPITAWNQGLLDAEQTGVVDPYQFLKSSPFDSKLFQDYFKVLKRTRVQLTQGATHRHTVNLAMNRHINEELLAAQSGDPAGLTHYTMIRWYGQPASILGSTPVDVTTAAIRIDTVQSWRYKYTWVSDSTRSVYINDALSSHAGEQVLSIGKGDFAPNVLG